VPATHRQSCPAPEQSLSVALGLVPCMVGRMGDVQGVLLAVVLVAMLTGVLTYRKHSHRYLIATYASTVVWFVGLAALIATYGSVRETVFAVVLAALALPVMLVRDWRRHRWPVECTWSPARRRRSALARCRGCPRSWPPLQVAPYLIFVQNWVGLVHHRAVDLLGLVGQIDAAEYR
jgi:uncharacterized membrane protein YfcA